MLLPPFLVPSSSSFLDFFVPSVTIEGGPLLDLDVPPLPPLPPIVGLPLLLFEADGAFPLLFLDLPVFPAVGVGGRADGTV